MKNTSTSYWPFFAIAFAVIAIDQISKLVIHETMELHTWFEVAGISWFKIYHTENPGMAFGVNLDWPYFKIVLTLFRFGAAVLFGYYIIYLSKRKAHKLLIASVAFILGGALGNVIDSTFYGVFLDNAPADAPFDWLFGQVVDFVYLDIYNGMLPEWIPFFGGKHVFLWPIFNVADASIFVGVASILVQQKKFFLGHAGNPRVAAEAETEENEA